MQEKVNDSQWNFSVKGKSVESKAWDKRVLHFVSEEKERIIATLIGLWLWPWGNKELLSDGFCLLPSRGQSYQLMVSRRVGERNVVAVVQSLSCVWLFETLWTAACQALLSFTISRSLLKFMSIESMMPYNHLVLCRPLFLLPSIFPSTKVFSNVLAIHIRWPKYWRFIFIISPPNEYSEEEGRHNKKWNSFCRKREQNC